MHNDGRLFVNASNIHHGGGAVLLRSLLASGFSQAPVTVFVDARMDCSGLEGDNIELIRVRKSLLQRVRCDREIAIRARAGDIVLNFGNLPPLFPSCALTICFIQNRYLLELATPTGFSLSIRARIWLERVWLRYGARHCRVFVVQSETMRDCLHRSGLNRHAKVLVNPFVPAGARYSRAGTARNRSRPHAAEVPGRFLYVASGEPHKNHDNLVAAWLLLAEKGLFPALELTLDPDRHPSLVSRIDAARQQAGVAIHNLGVLSHAETCERYRNADALIYPSFMESFGLPLIEARQAGLPVIASERDYVRDLLDPEECFDPDSPVSIARAVMRFLGATDDEQRIDDSRDFIDRLWTLRRG